MADPAEPLDAAALDADGQITAGVDLRLGFAEEGDASVIMFLFDLNARVPVARQFLVHARLPFAFSSFEVLGFDESAFSLGNLEVGGRWVGRSRDLRFGFGARLALPTASDDDEPGLGNIFAAAYIAAVDLGRYLPNTTTVGFDASGRWTNGRVFVQGEIGLDFFLVDDGGDNQMFYLRAVLGALVTETITLMAGIHNGFLLDEPFGAEDSVHALNLGATVRSAHVDVSPYAFLPLDDFGDPFGFGINVAGRF
jgi:hypothetical protein